MLSVEKIGGTSMSRFGEILENIFKQDTDNKKYNRIFVVSAYSNVTNWLLEHKKTGEQGIYAKFAKHEPFEEALQDLLGKLQSINSQFSSIGLDLKKADEYIAGRIEKTKSYLLSMAHILASGYVVMDNILLAGREILASIGEAHSAFNTVNILENNGFNAQFIDLSGFYDSDSMTIDERIAEGLTGIDFTNCLPIVTGYTNGIEGIMREFDRGYSEITFSKICEQVKADEAIIHKEFHLSSADPSIVGIENTVIVGDTNYDVADQLADIGMEAIHPKAAKPLETNGVKLRLKNAFDPKHEGTLITKDFIGVESKIEIITGSDKVSVVEVHDPLMVGETGFDYEIMSIFMKHKVSYIMKGTNANSISSVVWEMDLSDELMSELNSRFAQASTQQVAIVCVIGSNIAKPGILGKASKALADAGINISCVSQSMRQVNIQFVIDRKDYRDAIVVLNNELCLKD